MDKVADYFATGVALGRKICNDPIFRRVFNWGNEMRNRVGLTAFATFAGVFLLYAVVMTGSTLAQTAIGGLTPASPQPGKGAAQGLAVEYIRILARHVDEIEVAGKGKPGEPISMLDWNVGDGPVLTHEDDDGVAARISGFIKFEAAGDYMMAIQSNDGVRLTIGGKLIIDDPDVHMDRFSPNVTVQVPHAGWYPLYLLYFERKGTATLELYWQPPGADGFDFVPEEAFTH